MKCPKCRARIEDDLDRCTFCGNYLRGSMMDEYRLKDYDPTAGYGRNAPSQPVQQQKPKFRLFKK